MTAWYTKFIDVGALALGSLLLLLGTAVLFMAWRRRERHPGLLLLAWGLIAASFPFWSRAAGFDSGATIGTVLLTVAALAIVLANGDWRTKGSQRVARSCRSQGKQRMNVRFKLPREFVRSMLGSHSILGLTCAALLYLVCVSGTLAVFYPQMERWGQADVPESRTFDTAAVDAAAAAALARETQPPVHLFIALPTDDVPRTSVEVGETRGFVSANGTLGEPVDHQWTHFLVDLHYALSLPDLLGLALVGIIGIIMTAMIISGLLAHPNIFKDAFSFRIGGPRRLQQVDIHNRLSVWTSPFQLAIALTGAFIGLSQVFGLSSRQHSSAATRTPLRARCFCSMTNRPESPHR